MYISEADRKRLRILRIIATNMTVVAPVIYLVVVINLSEGHTIPSGQSDFLFYTLFVIGIIQPLAFWPMEKLHISNFRRSRTTNMLPSGLFFVLSLTRLALAGVVFIYGLILFYVTGDLLRMLWFYPVGIAWSFFAWPSNRRFEHFLRKIEK